MNEPLTPREWTFIIAALVYIVLASVVDCGPEPASNSNQSRWYISGVAQ